MKITLTDDETDRLKAIAMHLPEAEVRGVPPSKRAGVAIYRVFSAGLDAEEARLSALESKQAAGAKP